MRGAWYRRVIACAALGAVPACAPIRPDAPAPMRPAVAPVEVKSVANVPAPPPAVAVGTPLPIDLPTALALARANPLDIQIAGERLRAASAALDRANVIWLPNVGLGLDYYRHDGRIQDIAGVVFTTSRSSFLVGAGPTAIVPVGDAMYAPLAARQVVRARRADVQTAHNDTTLAVAEAYFTVQQARGDVGGALDALRRAEELVRLTEKVAPDLAPAVEINRAKAEAARRRLAVEAAHERWQVASADLARVLRLEPGTLVEPTDEPALAVELFDPGTPVADLVPVALTNRPELAADQALIQAALARVRQERVRPFVPTVALRGVGSNVPGLAGGYFGGGINADVGNFGGRFSFDLQAVWEVQNLGFGNRATVREREAERRAALLGLIRTQERVTAEVVQAHAQARGAANRLRAAADGVAHAAEVTEKNVRGLVPGKRVGDQLALVFRPQEAVAAVAALDQAYRDYFAAVGDNNRAQFRLYRALGHPAQNLGDVPTRVVPVPALAAPAPKAEPKADPKPAPPAVPAVRAEQNPPPPAPRPAEPVWRTAGGS